MLDRILRGGQLIDGSGSAPRAVDVGILNGRIDALGRLDGAEAAEVLDVDGLIVAPGFIDPHSHADLILAQEPGRAARLLAGRVGQGITTTLVGNCGMGAAPRDETSEPVLRGLNGWMTPDEVPWPWDDLGGFLDELGRRSLPLNVGALQAHGPLRIDAMGASSGPAPPGARERMEGRLRDALGHGAFGLSAGLIYPPGMYADTGELLALARVVAEADAVFAFHVRGSSELLLPSVDEIIGIGRDSGCRVHHSHNEAVGRAHWPKLDRVLEREDRARAAGVRLSHDLFPYHAAATLMAALFPPAALAGGMEALLERLRDPASRDALRLTMEEAVPSWPPWEEGGWPHNLVRAVGWAALRVASVRGPGEAVVGRSLADLGATAGATPFDALARLMLENGGQVGQLVEEITGTEEENGPMERLVSHPAGAFCTDAEDLGRGLPHPAAYGAFPRVLGRWVRERGVLTLPDAIRRMTTLPAESFGIRERGAVREGYHADLVVLDPATVADRASYTRPRQAPEGIVHVLINGRSAIRDGAACAGAASGEVLRR